VACEEDPALPGPGERCTTSLASACADELVCVDGLCRPRAQNPTPEVPGPDALATFDIDSPEDTPDSTDTTDSPDTSSDTDTGPIIERVTLTTWDPENPATTRLALGIGQAAAVGVFVPLDSRPEQLLVVAWRPDAPACGLFRPLVWLPRPSADDPTVVDFPVMPDLIGVARPIETAVGSQAFAALPLPETLEDGTAAKLARAPHRIGVRYEGPCTPNDVAPYLQLDASGDTRDTWVWSDAWIPGADLGLPGRWAFALQLRVE
jgi:hypothetical protein